MSITLAQIVEMSARALEVEDRSIRLAKSMNHAAYGDSRSGILHIVNERYYQFVVARAMFAIAGLRVAVEHETNDLVLLTADGERSITIEMKRWMSKNGDRELPGIRGDIKKLESVKCGTKIMLLFSACPLKTTSTQLEYLKANLGVSNMGWRQSVFVVNDAENNECEFFVAGLAV